jgi:uncharacterized protein (TIRG00374 family)
MNSSRPLHLRYLLGLGVSVLFLWLALRKVDFRELWQVIANAEFGLLLLVMLLTFAMLFLRGLRWYFFLKPIRRLPVIGLGWSVAIGFAVNNIIGARLGEVARSLSVSRKYGLAAATVLGTVVVERVWDAVSLLALVAIGLFLWDFSRPLEQLVVAVDQGLGIQLDPSAIVVSTSVVIVVILVGVAVVRFWGEGIASGLDRTLALLPKRWRRVFTEGLRSFSRGLTQTSNPLEVCEVVLLSALVWVAGSFGVWICLRACHIDAGPVDAAFVLFALAVAVAIPSGPGYFGTYHFIAASAIGLSTGAPWSQATGAAIVLHLSHYLPRTVAGILALVREGLGLGELKRDRTATDETGYRNNNTVDTIGSR